MAASKHLQNGERGYTIGEKAESSEFETLFDHFNTMSAELKNQFERSYQEQQALQQARMKALQSQINPHFLNNTLEIINWEARLAENDRVSAMIEALSVMMDGALARDGRSRIPLREELRYVDAYLYIIRERLGERLKVVREIDEVCELADALGRADDAEHYRALAEEVRARCSDVLWDGEWFLRGITADNRKIGTRTDQEGKVHMESNTWAVISGAANREQGLSAMDSVDKYLFTEYGLML